LAIRTAVNAIDASMAELKGGTTGQVLSKTSNTDMDFTWIAQDDSNAIQNAIVDAKGDLIAASAADTPARLAVGTNLAFLQADSSTATGLKWNYDDYTSYTPTISATTGSITTYTSSGAYIRIGKTCIYRATFSISNNGTGAGQIRLSLPFTSFNYASGMVGAGRDTGLTGKMVQAFIGGNDGNANLWFYDNTYPGGTGATIGLSITYQVA
jgi:hypothetical protein